MGNPSNLNLTNTGTVAGWVKVSSGVYSNIIGKGCAAGWDTDGYAIEYGSYFGNNVMGYFVNQTSNPGHGVISVNFGHPVVNTWHYYVMKWDGSYVYAYLDGVEVDKVTQVFNLSATASDFKFASPYAWGGVIDEVRVYSRAITVPQIQTLYNIGRLNHK